MQQASRKAEPGDYKHAVNDIVGMKLSKEVANVGVTVHVQQRLNGPHGTPVHDFLAVISKCFNIRTHPLPSLAGNKS